MSKDFHKNHKKLIGRNGTGCLSPLSEKTISLITSLQISVSRIVKPISVETTQFVVLCYGGPTKLIQILITGSGILQ